MSPSGGSPKRLLFLCTSNSCRSQMAEALTKHIGRDSWRAFSAGTKPRPIHPLTHRALGELGIDMAGQRPKGVEEFEGERFDLVVTVCDDARESCPVPPPAADYRHWSLTDPAAASGSEAERLAVFRRVRDDLRSRIEALLAEHEG
jgi:arsenate reductase